jgi:DNA-binding response OmpR family regulator/uncharacterized membrane protein YgaE (UPF0421/DUF939 family)
VVFVNPVSRLRSSSRSPFLQVVKTAVAVVAAVLLCELVIRGPFPTFAAIAALLVVQPSINQSFVKGLERSAGVVLGVVLATGLHFLLGDAVWVVLLAIVVSILVAWALRLTPTSATQVGISGMLVLTAGVVTPNYSADRVLETVLGAAVALVVNAVIVPPVLLRPGHLAVARLARDTAVAFERVAIGLTEGWDHDRWHDALLRARSLRQQHAKADAALTAARESLTMNPRGGRHRTILDRDVAVTEHLRVLVTRVTGMTRAIRPTIGSARRSGGRSSPPSWRRPSRRPSRRSPNRPSPHPSRSSGRTPGTGSSSGPCSRTSAGCARSSSARTTDGAGRTPVPGGSALRQRGGGGGGGRDRGRADDVAPDHPGRHRGVGRDHLGGREPTELGDHGLLSGFASGAARDVRDGGAQLGHDAVATDVLELRERSDALPRGVELGAESDDCRVVGVVVHGSPRDRTVCRVHPVLPGSLATKQAVLTSLDHGPRCDEIQSGSRWESHRTPVRCHDGSREVTMRLLVVEDDDEMRALMERGLAAEGYRVTAVENGVEALIALGDNAFDLAVVDVMMPGMSGFELARRIREREDPVRILLVTARDGVDDRVFGLDAGADDYLTKPFAFAELTARLRALGRRESAGAPRIIEVGDVAIDSEARRVSIQGQRVAVSPTEFALLRLLARSVGTVVDRPKILEEVWDGSQHVDPNVVEQYISYLRKKLTSHEATVAISTVRGRGYRLDLLGS